MARQRPVSSHLALGIAELALLGVSVAAVLGFERLFTDNTWRGPLLATAVLAHLIAAVLRRTRTPVLLAFALYGLAGGLTLTQLFYEPTTRWALIPTGTTASDASTDIETAINAFPDAIAPTEAITGFVLLAALAVWVLAGVADALAFGSRVTLTSLVPAAITVTFIAALGSEEDRLGLTAVVFAAAALFVVVHRAWVVPGQHRWLGNATDTRFAISRSATPAVLVSCLVAIVGLPLIPGADEPILDSAGGGAGQGAPSRVVISPLVDIRARLVQQADIEVFQVRSPQPSYWRLTSLDTFDNSVWSSRADYDDANSGLDLEVVSGESTQSITQQFRIEALAAVWLPAAFQPQRISDLNGADVSWEPRSATLIVDKSSETSDGIDYAIESSLPHFTQAQLAVLPAGYPEGFETFVDLPPDFSPTAASIARDVTGNANTPYEQAIALQSYFRDNFTYDLNVASGHDLSRIEDFLSLRVGYCEQFAGTFSAMARSLGLPARVAVGFTWGDTDPDDPTLFRVRGEHAHAWPEVYIEGAGWVAFEPTPGRGSPNGDYTGVTAQQDESGLAAPDDGSGLSPAIPNPNDPRLDEVDEFDPGSGLAAGVEGDAEDDSFSVPLWLKVAAVTIFAILAIGALVPIVSRFARRWGQRRVGDQGRQRVLTIWDDTVAAILPLGLRPRPAETTYEFVSRTVPLLGEQPRLTKLAALVDEARYSDTELNQAAEAHAAETLVAVSTSVRARTNWWDRYRTQFDFLRLHRS